MANRHLAEAIRRERVAKGLSMAALARGAGLYAHQISGYENEQVNPSLDTLYKIAKALDIPVSRLTEQPQEAATHE